MGGPGRGAAFSARFSDLIPVEVSLRSRLSLRRRPCDAVTQAVGAPGSPEPTCDTLGWKVGGPRTGAERPLAHALAPAPALHQRCLALGRLQSP